MLRVCQRRWGARGACVVSVVLQQSAGTWPPARIPTAYFRRCVFLFVEGGPWATGQYLKKTVGTRVGRQRVARMRSRPTRSSAPVCRGLWPIALSLLDVDFFMNPPCFTMMARLFRDMHLGVATCHSRHTIGSGLQHGCTPGDVGRDGRLRQSGMCQ